MRRPSNRLFPNTVALYRFTGEQTSALGLAKEPYALITASVVCSVQPDQPERVFDGASIRVVQKGSGAILFPDDQGLSINDKAVWVDRAGATHHLFITGVADQAGRGAMFEYSYEERFK